jgi:hypothetical protein
MAENIYVVPIDSKWKVRFQMKMCTRMHMREKEIRNQEQGVTI